MTLINQSTERMCGVRSPGIYACCGTSPWGKPVEEFLFCPPLLVPEWIEVPNLGSVIAEANGKNHIFDHVGSGNYPNVADAIEEIRRMGVSRRLSPLLNYSLLGPGSGIFLVHEKAFIENWEEYTPIYQECPKGIEYHTLQERVGFCSGIWWEDLVQGEYLSHQINSRYVRRYMPCGSYYGYSKPEDVTPVYQERIFAWFPITRLEVITGNQKDNEYHAEMAQASALPFEFMEE